MHWFIKELIDNGVIDFSNEVVEEMEKALSEPSPVLPISVEMYLIDRVSKNSITDVKLYISTPERPLYYPEFVKYWESLSTLEKMDILEMELPSDEVDYVIDVDNGRSVIFHGKPFEVRSWLLKQEREQHYDQALTYVIRLGASGMTIPVYAYL